MRKTRMAGAMGTSLVAALAAGACYDFDGARQRCSDEGRCEPNVAACTPVPGVDLPDDAFTDTDCDGVDGQADAGLFIDPVDGDDDAGTGTRQAPLRTVGRALEMARALDGGPGHLFLAGGAYDEADLVLDVPVSLHGGYAGRGGGWRRSADRLALLDAGTPGLTVRGLRDAGVVLEYVQVHAATATGPGEPSIAVRMVDSSGVRLRHVTLAAGRGGQGSAGLPGDTGLAGPAGGAGQDGGVENSNIGRGGQPGPITCPDGSEPLGGMGMLGGAAGTTGRDGGAGGPDGAGGAGGAGGPSSGYTDCLDVGGMRECVCHPEPGSPGLTGADGGPGEAGPGGSGRGQVGGETWAADQSGEPGGAGTSGFGGGGGGSGGTCVDPELSVASGGGSGAGGGGGCGGEGGQGGGGGGASISLLLVGSQAAVEEGSVMRTLGGGAGGEGGAGGPGGAGGEGGASGVGGRVEATEGNTRYRTYGGWGGPGGPGGHGGPGGSGGGGGGGPSVGVWCGPNSGVVFTEGGVAFELGLGGPGGEGPGQLGAPGEQAPHIDCVSTPP
ncbi:DUF1565 domain-containing protein [Corallococcus macrosporus]|uniref:DUF1565 domain-containing protein n=1 Tax=Corallococcus macrosporus DSM 14697 TaxID=1189310 RepID=A0A250JNX6_9BACT|nr:DUF1565 domain-containing protein [Corallococcus macrosporus]ATB45187.1 hypothetical protein MYMAC_000771 [Corallococcus macrosporus DSM 14697]